ncbi:MAG: hypothetical protein K2W33_04770, partial [Burkholderiales bacterium]|nr:hypothetical protein [Burkholderiales bacterium]
ERHTSSATHLLNFTLAGSQLLGVQTDIGACKRCAVCLAAHCGIRANLVAVNCGVTMTTGAMAVLRVRHALVGF